MQRSTVPALTLALALALSSPLAFAQPAIAEPAPPSWSIQWNAPRGCPTQRQVLARVRAQLGSNVVRPTAVDVVVTEQADEWIASVRIGSESPARDVRADSCDRVASAAAVIVGVALAPEPAATPPAPPSLTPIATSSATPSRPATAPFSISRRFPTPARIALFEEAISENDAQWRNERAANFGYGLVSSGGLALMSVAILTAPWGFANTPTGAPGDIDATTAVRLGTGITAASFAAVSLGVSLGFALRAAPSPYVGFASELHGAIERGESNEAALDRAETAWRRAAREAHDARVRAGVFGIVFGSILGAAGIAAAAVETRTSAPNVPQLPWTGLSAILAGTIYVGIGVERMYVESSIETSFSRYQRRNRHSVWPLIIPIANGGGVGFAGTF